MATRGDVWAGPELGNEVLFADVLEVNGDALFARSISNDEADLKALLTRLRGLASRGW